MKAALIPDRGVLRVSGPGARPFLNGLVTADIDTVGPDRARFAALLSPQGKILFDFFVVGDGSDDGLWLETSREQAAGLATRLRFYKLRAKVTIADVSEEVAVIAIWDGPTLPASDVMTYADPRLQALGHRAVLPADAAAGFLETVGAQLTDAGAYEAHRIALGLPQGGLDFAYGDAFPHEADMDQLGGIDFDKGCYVGQEVVSRMQHRGNARTRIVPVTVTGTAPPPGTGVTAGGKSLGTMGASSANRGLAMLRLDRVNDAIAAGQPLAAGDATLTLVKPDWARFAWPGEAAATAGAAE